MTKKLDNLIPTMEAERLSTVDISDIFAMGCNTVLLDMDNTVTPWNCRTPFSDAGLWIYCALQEGLKLYIVSNGRGSRARDVARSLNIGCFTGVNKPSEKGMRRVLDEIGIPSENVCLIGDQLYTDILAANRTGIKSILVMPDSKREFIFTRLFNRTREKKIRPLVSKALAGNNDKTSVKNSQRQ